ncbi:hypothetical protein ANCCEY_14809 [Ancylostoma ceylanicum]|uniref:Chondroitin proteoglycan 4 domain-containing protein n=1 Tax=Ancylostoma ceylanicum TaxID=53326 RepID=A0A0D6L4G4_9BILA|nr:hypothetical protein ANCCEY_14809 [Ancylostoma ceylanicum]
MIAICCFESLAKSWFTGKQLADELESLPPCQRECAKDLHDTVGDVLNGGSYVTKYHRTCAAYKEARRCIIEKRDKCDENVEMFAVATSGIKYMCIEQGKAFNASIECIDHNAHQVQGLCEEHCDAKGALMRIFTESSLMNSFGEVFQLLRAESALQPAAFGDSPLPFEPGLLHFGLSPQTGNGMGNVGTANGARTTKVHVASPGSRHGDASELQIFIERYEANASSNRTENTSESATYVWHDGRVEEMYANETFVDAENRVNGTDSSEESISQTVTDDLLTTANITANSTLVEEGPDEGSGNIEEVKFNAVNQMLYQSLCEIGNSSGVPEGSGEDQEELGEVVFRSVLSTTPSYFEFTANSTGKYIT